MKNNCVMLFAVVATLGLAACDTGESETDAVSATAAETSLSETATDAKSRLTTRIQLCIATQQ